MTATIAFNYGGKTGYNDKLRFENKMSSDLPRQKFLEARCNQKEAPYSMEIEMKSGLGPKCPNSKFHCLDISINELIIYFIALV